MTYHNALTVPDRVKAMIAAEQPRPRTVILDAGCRTSLT